MYPAEDMKFIADHNVAKLARWLRMMGYDTLIFDQPDDWQMIRTALAEDRIILTRDTGVMKRRVITSGKLKALLVTGDDPEEQIRQVITVFRLKNRRPFSLCLECSKPLVPRTRDEVKNRVPPYVYRTQTQFVECPVCHRVYWQGTHWEAMHQALEKLGGDEERKPDDQKE
ncbi:MAG: Mut7-C RNAse domain-containing protein [Dehalococcoidia bacterium]|nr:Mut7-C RNAse domain-containing protein [Dehalococcoidia bacterium]